MLDCFCCVPLSHKLARSAVWLMERLYAKVRLRIQPHLRILPLCSCIQPGVVGMSEVDLQILEDHSVLPGPTRYVRPVQRAAVFPHFLAEAGAVIAAERCRGRCTGWGPRLS